MLGQHLILVAIMIFEKRRESSRRKKKKSNQWRECNAQLSMPP